MNKSEVNFIKLKNTVMVTLNGQTFTVSNSHPLFEKIVNAIDNNELDQLSALVEHTDRENRIDF